MDKFDNLDLIELSGNDLKNVNGGFWPLAYALVYASIAVPFHAGWNAYEE